MDQEIKRDKLFFIGTAFVYSLVIVLSILFTFNFDKVQEELPKIFIFVGIAYIFLLNTVFLFLYLFSKYSKIILKGDDIILKSRQGDVIIPYHKVKEVAYKGLPNNMYVGRLEIITEEETYKIKFMRKIQEIKILLDTFIIDRKRANKNNM